MQELLHSSVSVLLPSSHSSVPFKIPSPQLGAARLELTEEASEEALDELDSSGAPPADSLEERALELELKKVSLEELNPVEEDVADAEVDTDDVTAADELPPNGSGGRDDELLPPNGSGTPMLQVLVHVSKLSELPSSHFSAFSTIPLPHPVMPRTRTVALEDSLTMKT